MAKFINLLLFGLSLQCVNSQLSSEQKQAIEDFIEKSFIPSNKVPGLGLAIVTGEEVALTKGYGFADKEAGIPADENTLFGIASVSKSICSLLTVKILQEKFPKLGESALDIPIRKLVPDYNLTLIDRYRSESINLRDLIAHRTCLMPEMVHTMTESFNTTEEYHYRFRYMPEVCQFRTKFVYSNPMYDLAGDVISHIMGRPYIDLLEELFRDLGMTSSQPIRNIDYHKVGNLARPYYLKSRDDPEASPVNLDLLKRFWMITPAGGVLSTPKDMANYLLIHLNKGKLGGKQILPQEVLERMRVPSNLFAGGFTGGMGSNGTDLINGDFYYGLGLFIGVYDGLEVISHGGYLPPYNGFLSFWPKLKVGVYSVTNGPGSLSQISHRNLHNKIIDILRGKEGASKMAGFVDGEVSKMPKSDVISLKAAQEEIPLEKFAGVFGNGALGDITISHSVENGSLYFRMGKWGTGGLVPDESKVNSFSINWDSDMTQPPLFGMIGDYDAHVQFYTKDMFVFTMVGMPAQFIRGMTLDKLPEKVWKDESCSP